MAQRDDLHALGADVDMLIRLVTRVDHTVDAVPKDIRSLWPHSEVDLALAPPD